MKTIQTILHPAQYQGHTATDPYFEGWYYKLISKDMSQRFAVIPGISLSRESDEPHSFIQVLEGNSGETAYYRYPLTGFSAAKKTFEVQIGPNRFTETSLTLDLPAGNLSLNGHLEFMDTKPWPVTLINPGIMGWYAWVPRMECYHGVVSMDHEIQGSLKQDGQLLTFSQGHGYIEKDWGQAFPSAWIWMQSNHFEESGTSLTASIAMIPWMKHAFRGMIVGFLHQGQLYRFATYTGARTRSIEVISNTVKWTLQDRRYELTIYATNGKSGDLRGPSRSDMARRVPETLQATIRVQLTDMRSKEVIYLGHGLCGGLELGGDLETLLTYTR